MIRHTFQSLPVNRFDVHIVEASELMPHDPPHGVTVLKLIGECRENVSQDPERCAPGSFDIQVVAQIGEVFGNGVDVGGLFVLHPRLAAGLSEHQIIVRTLSDDRTQGCNRLGPERDLTQGHALAANGIDSLLGEPHVNTLQSGAVGSAHAAVESEQDHRFELTGGLLDQLSERGRLEHSSSLAAAQVAGADFLESFPQPDRMSEPPAFVGVVEHGNNAGAFSVVGIAPNLAQQVPPVVGKVFRPKVADQTRTGDPFQKAVNCPADIRNVAGGNVASFKALFLFLSEGVGQLLQGKGFGLGNDAWFTSIIEIAFYPVVFGERQGSVIVAAEVVEVTVDSLLESSVGAGLGGEAFDGLDLVTTCHADTLSTDGGICDSIQLSSQATSARLQNMRNPATGSVAQRLEQGTHNPVATHQPEENNADSSQIGTAPPAQSPNQSSVGSQLNTADEWLGAGQRYGRLFRAPESIKKIADVRSLPEFRLPLKICFVYFLLLRGRIAYIGMTTDLLRRITKHWDQKHGEFDEVRFLRVRIDEMESVERQLIERLKPRLNSPYKKKRRGYQLAWFGNPARQRKQMIKGLTDAVRDARKSAATGGRRS